MAERMTVADLDIAAFLRARLDEQEADSTGPPDSDSVHALGCDLNSGYDLNSECWPDWPVKCDCGEPEWQLADVAAKRQIIAMHERAVYSWGGVNRAYCRKCAVGDSCDECLDYETQVWPCSTLSLLALPFAGHPDYDESWKP